MARASLSHVPSHGSREVLVIYGSLSTSDPGNIQDTITKLVADRVRVSIVGLAAEVQICRVLTKRTTGSYGVVLNEGHFRDLLFEIIPPPAIHSSRNASDLIQMGFPTRIIPGGTNTGLSLCVCHSKLKPGGYICPRCLSKVCDLPRDCDICGLTLVSSPHLARSFHHLFPVPNYAEVQWKDLKPKENGVNGVNGKAHPHQKQCFACQLPFPEMDTTSGIVSSTGASTNAIAAPSVLSSSSKQAATTQTNRYKCPLCRNDFCLECNVFVHDVLHNCPGCVSSGTGAGGVVGRQSNPSNSLRPGSSLRESMQID